MRVAFLVCSVGAGFLAPVQVEKEKAESGRGEVSTGAHSFIHSSFNKHFLSPMPARLRAWCWNSQVDLVLFLLSKSISVWGDGCVNRPRQGPGW